MYGMCVLRVGGKISTQGSTVAGSHHPVFVSSRGCRSWGWRGEPGGGGGHGKDTITSWWMMLSTALCCPPGCSAPGPLFYLFYVAFLLPLRLVGTWLASRRRWLVQSHSLTARHSLCVPCLVHRSPLTPHAPGWSAPGPHFLIFCMLRFYCPAGWSAAGSLQGGDGQGRGSAAGGTAAGRAGAEGGGEEVNK